ncbi:MAG: S-layer homology domain-containing protein [Clostridia bacterium]|nr:S-layer homology domain-containing protein [Clostridia bacterium]
MKRIFFFSIVFIFLFTGVALASEKISPAIDVIANESNMIKSGVLNDGELCFDTSDFDNTLGTNVKSIKVTALPEVSSGRLMLDNLYVVENQVIYRDDFSLLKFVSTNSAESPVFKFKPNGFDYEIECSLISLESVNLSPVASNGAGISAWTMKNVSCFGTLLGYDPEGDELKFEAASLPKKGLLTISNNKTGDFLYTPYENAKGTDAFSYRVRDSYGNYSETCTVNIKIEKNAPSMVFSDVEEKYICATSIACENELMTWSKSDDGVLCFEPNAEVTREEFVVMIMRAMGAESAPTIEKTRFADDNEISPQYKGYIESAFSLGIVKGKTENDGIHFNPKDPITLADAAVIINNIIGRKTTTSLTVFADDDEIPNWARHDIEALCEAGILKKNDGEISPNAPLTKAQVAQILMSLIKYRGK